MRRRSFGQVTTAQHARHKPSARLRIETLEDRRLLTTFFVTNTFDNGPGSLRQAIIDSNTQNTSDIIDFNIDGAGVHKISLTTTPLPTIQDTLLIDGTTQPVNGGPTVTTPLIQIDGSQLPAGTNDGLTINLATGTAPSTIRGLAITGFSGSGVVINGAGGNNVQQSLIGTDPTGTTAAPNGVGITINGSPNNTIGGTQAVFRNVISGNLGDGILITGAGSTANAVQGNYIGIDIGGVTAIPNQAGVVVSGAPSNSIGGAVLASRNVISGNTTFGVEITGAGASNNAVQANFIGVNATGNGAVANDVGVQIDTGAATNLIGGSASTTNRNIISGNLTSNISIIASSTNQIIGNTVGLNSDGTSVINLTQATKAGIEIEDGSVGNTIGGTSSSSGNVISGSAGPNLQIRGKTSSTVTATAANNLIQGNNIGTNLAGTAAASTTTGGGGIVLTDGTTGNTIGAATGVAVPNVISGNIGAGISLLGAGTSQNVILGNNIGVRADGTTALANTGAGVFADGATLNTIGGTTTSAGNILADNGGAGVFVNTSSTGITISHNSIFGNTGLGIDLAPTGVNPNSPTQPGVGANNLQNYPVITGVSTANGVTTVTGTLQSSVNTAFTVELFSNTAADASGNGQGKVFVGSTNVSTDATGTKTFTVTTTTAVALGAFISATATDGGGNTSEFSADVANTAPTADLNLTLVGVPQPVAGTGFITYTMTVTNKGPSNATNVILTNTLPTGVSFIGATSSTGSVTQSGSTVTANLGGFILNATATVTITVVAPSTSTTSLTDTATVTLNENDPNTANNTATFTSTVVQGPNLSVTTTVTPTTTGVGSPATITYTVTNNSTTNAATNVSLIAPIPASLTPINSFVTQGSSTASGQTLTAAFGTLGVGASATVTLMVNPTTTGTFLTTATISSDAPNVNTSTLSATSTLIVSTTGTPVTADGPRVLGLDRSGYHKQTTRLVLTFSGTLIQSTATNLANYRLIAAGKDKKLGTKDDVKYKIKSAFYDNTARTVVLSTKKPLPLHQEAQLTAVGSVPTGITGTSGLLLDGADTGSPGSDFVQQFSYVGPGRISVTSVGASIASKRHIVHKTRAK